MCIIKNENAMKTIEKMSKFELSKMLYQINPSLYFKTSPWITTTKAYRLIIQRELDKKNN